MEIDQVDITTASKFSYLKELVISKVRALVMVFLSIQKDMREQKQFSKLNLGNLAK